MFIECNGWAASQPNPDLALPVIYYTVSFLYSLFTFHWLSYRLVMSHAIVMFNDGVGKCTLRKLLLNMLLKIKHRLLILQ